MGVKNLLILVLVIVLAVGAALGGTFLYFTWQETFPAAKTSGPPEANQPKEPLFPQGEPQKTAPEPPQSFSGKKSTTTDNGLGVKEPIPSQFSKIVSGPVGGFFIAGAGTTTQIIYADRASGHLYTITPAEGVNPVRVSNTTIPKIYELFGGATGKDLKVIIRYLKNDSRQNFSGQLARQPDLNSEPTALAGKFLSSQIYSFALSPSQDKMFYLERAGGVTNGAVANLDDGKKSVIFSSPFNEWRAGWPNLNTVALQTKTAVDIPGSLYFLDLKTRLQTKIISGVPGLTTLVSPDLKRVAYSAQGQRGLVFGVYNVKERIFGRLPFRTLSDKCVWGKNGLNLYCAAPADLPEANYPDDWYSGEIGLTDRFWKIDAETSQSKLIFDPRLAGLNIEVDASNPATDDEESFIVFLNKKDLSLWMLNLKEGF